MQPCKSQDCTEHGTYTTQQNIILGVSGSGSVALASHTASNKNKPKNMQNTKFTKSISFFAAMQTPRWEGT